LELAARRFLQRLDRAELEQRDLKIIKQRVDALNAEAEDVLSYQAPL